MRQFVCCAIASCLLVWASASADDAAPGAAAPEATATVVAPPDPALVKAALRDAGGNVMEIAQNDPRLDVSLHLSDRDVTDEVLAPLATMTQVAWLNLAGTKITDTGLVHLAALKGLEKLHLERTAIGDEGLKQLSGLEKLVYLNLYGTQVTDAGLVHLESLKGLRRLYVWQTKVTPEGIAKLKEKLPELRVVAGLELAPVEPPKEAKPEEKK